MTTKTNRTDDLRCPIEFGYHICEPRYSAVCIRCDLASCSGCNAAMSPEEAAYSVMVTADHRAVYCPDCLEVDDVRIAACHGIQQAGHFVACYQPGGCRRGGPAYLSAPRLADVSAMMGGNGRCSANAFLFTRGPATPVRR